MAYGVVDAIQGGVRKVFSLTGSGLKTFGRSAWENPFFRVVFAPFFIAGKGIKMGYEGVKWGALKTEWAGRTLYQGGVGAVKATARPALTLGFSALRDVKICLWDLPLSVLKGMIRMPIALAKSPVELVRGVRDSIKSVPKNTMEFLQNLKQLEVRNSIKSLFKIPKDFILPPFTRPLAPVLAPAGNVVATAARSKLQYLFAIKDSAHQVADGVRHVRNAPNIASQNMAVVTAARAEKKKKRLEEKEEEKKEAMSKLSEAKGKGGKGKGK